MKSFVKFRSPKSRRRQARRFSPWQSALERLEDRTLLTAPTLDNPIADQTAPLGESFIFVVPSNTFTDADGDAITLAATGVPSWLTFTPATGTFMGTPMDVDPTTSNITVTATAGGESVSDTFTVTLLPNAVPSFTKGANQTTLEDAVAQTVSNWAANISAGLNEPSQSVEFIVSNDNPGLFSAAPAISPTGELTYTPAANANGSAIVTVFIHDDGGTANGGVDTSMAQTFTITITPVNDAPSFTVGANQTALEDSGAQTVTNFATAINAGTAETGQTVDFLVSNDTPSLFSVQPSISASGTLTYTPAANANGTATVTVFIHDDGGTADGGVDTSTSQTFTITLTGVNDAPSFTKGPDQTVLEDAVAQSVTNWATNISAGTGDMGQTVDFQVTNNNTGLFSVQPAISATGTLTYTPSANANGTATVTVLIHDNGGTANGGVEVSASQTFTITVTAVNDVPSFTVGANQTVLEDSAQQTVTNFVTGISAGTNDVGQTVDFIVSNDSTAFFSVQPAISPTGTLTYTPAANANGTATVTVVIHDNGGTANGGVDTSVAQTFTITLTGVNDAPSFTKGPNQTVVEDAGAQSVTNWATNISAGTGDLGQTVDFLVSNDNTGLFSVQPAIAANGTLTYTPAANMSGTATVTVIIHDNGGTANGGVEVSAAQTFTITVTGVNDAPSFTVGGNQTVLEDSGSQTVNNFVTNISAGAGDSGQTVDFLVSNNNPSLFSSQPTISANGTLTYTPAANANGTTTVTVILHDNGGTANGGDDTSDPQTFTITITGINDAPSFTKGPDQTVLEDAGAQSVANWATNISAGTGDMGQTVDFQVSNNNNALFTPLGQPAISPDGTLTYTLAANQNGTATVTVVLHDDGGVESSAAQTFTITVTSVNDAPSFTVGPDLTVLVNSPAQTFLNFVKDISAGPNETQTVDFIVTNDNQGFFTAQPAIDASGTLTFTPAAGAFGTATVSVQIHDDGGIANGGVDTSAVQTFTITITTTTTGATITDANPIYRVPANVKLRAVVIDGLLNVQFNGVPQRFFEPGVIETLTFIGGSKNDEIDLAGLDDVVYDDLALVVIRSGAGNDRVVGSFADDSIDGGTGNDTLSGGLGDDMLVGNAGTDLLTESADEDMTLTDTTLTGGLGDDRILTIEKAMLIGGAGDNDIDASGFTKGSVTLLGGAGDDTLTGGTKNDLILGEDGDDELFGGDGKDTLLGGFGDDDLNGEDGNDLLIGGFDADTLDGGDGRDTVVGGNGGAARGGDGVADAGDLFTPDAADRIDEAFKKLFAFE